MKGRLRLVVAVAGMLALCSCSGGGEPGTDLGDGTDLAVETSETEVTDTRADGLVPDSAPPPCQPDTSCDDSDPCTCDDWCSADGVCAGTAYECDDGRECTSDNCDGQGDCTFEIVAGACLINGLCYESGQLHSNKPCRECIPAISQTQWTDDDSNTCTDGNECLVGDHCDAGECMAGTITPDCDDNSPCTTDSCNPASGCSNAAIAGPCNDDDPCTSDDLCQDGKCVGQVVDCDDGNPCTIDSCNATTGCTYENAGGDCSDGNPCTVGDFCQEGKCKPGATPLNCDDSNPCTTDSCSQTDGCKHKDNSDSCDDQDACTVGDFCKEGQCAGNLGQIDCGDANVCTKDSCDPVMGCAYSPEVGECSDGNPCTVGDVCSGGQCAAGAGMPDCDDGDPCTTDTCQPPQGCAHTLFAGPCDDGNQCTVDDACVAGLCTGLIKTCNDSNPCTLDSCNPFLPGGCTASPAPGPCNDGDPCSLNDSCENGQCKAGTQLLACDDANACTADSCQKGVGCVHQNQVGLCEDGNPCTSGDYCANGQCYSGGNICACQSDADCIPQDDGNLCNGTLACDKSSPAPANWACVPDPDSVVDCDGLDTVCLDYECVPASGACASSPANEGGACNDGSGCTLEDKCHNGGCSGLPCASYGKSCVNNKCVDQVCGNGNQEPGEECDDGNLANGDGCSAACKFECPPSCGPPLETVIAPFNAANGAYSSGKYSGTVLLTVYGVGQSNATCFNDAFYVYQGCGSTPKYSAGAYHLKINNKNPADQTGLPPYSSDHIYQFWYSLAAPTGNINFKVADGAFNDNSGAYYIDIHQ